MKPERYNFNATAIFLSIALLALPNIQPVHAEGSDIAALRIQMQELQRTVRTLQQQVTDLQNRLPPADTATQPVAPPKRNVSRQRETAPSDDIPVASDRSTLSKQSIRDNWHALKRGMSDQDVYALIGAPTSRFKLNNAPVWYYDYQGIGRGSVMFSKEGKLIDWQAPPTHWLW